MRNDGFRLGRERAFQVRFMGHREVYHMGQKEPAAPKRAGGKG